jgi:hypothetical protein
MLVDASAARSFAVIGWTRRSSSTLCGLPPGGLHPIGADHCPEREPSRAWSAGLPRCFGRTEAPRAEVCVSSEGRGQRILDPLTAPVEG